MPQNAANASPNRRSYEYVRSERPEMVHFEECSASRTFRCILASARGQSGQRRVRTGEPPLMARRESGDAAIDNLQLSHQTRVQPHMYSILRSDGVASFPTQCSN